MSRAHSPKIQVEVWSDPDWRSTKVYVRPNSFVSTVFRKASGSLRCLSEATYALIGSSKDEVSRGRWDTVSLDGETLVSFF